MSCESCGYVGQRTGPECPACGRAGWPGQSSRPRRYSRDRHPSEDGWDFHEAEIDGQQVWLTSLDEFERYESTLTPNIRFADVGLTKKGYSNLVYRSRPVVWSAS